MRCPEAILEHIEFLLGLLPSIVHERPRLTIPGETALHVSTAAQPETFDEKLPRCSVLVLEDPPESLISHGVHEGLLGVPGQAHHLPPFGVCPLDQERTVGVWVSRFPAEVLERFVSIFLL